MTTWILMLGAALTSSSWALQPPAGWHAVDPYTAVLDPAAPERGEVREVVIAGGSGEPEELLAVLKGVGVSVTSHQAEADGALNLVIPGRLARARHVVQEGQATWAVVTVAPEHAASLDPDALLNAVLPRVTAGSAWGTGNAAPLSGGGDGMPWGAEEVVQADGWVTDSTVEAWAQDSTVVGIWEGSTLLSGIPTNLRFRFENTGDVILERTPGKGKSQVYEGRWTTRQGLMKLDVKGGGEAVSYKALGSTLTLEYDSARVTLYKKKK